MNRTVSVIRCGEKRISEIDVRTIQRGDVFFVDSVFSRKFALCAGAEIETSGPYAWKVNEVGTDNFWYVGDLLSNVKPYVITCDNDPYAIPSAERLELNTITEKVLGLRAARAAAEEDGIKLICDIPAVPKKWYIDTEENRRIINSYLQNRNRVLGFPNMVLYTNGKYISDLSIWGAGVFRELWDPHKKEYIQKENLPVPLRKAYDNLWESSGDDYLVEYYGNYYLMLDHAYYKDSADYYGVQGLSELFDIALENAKTAASHDALKDCLVLVSKSCKENGDIHFVSVLIDAEASKEKVDQIKGILAECMFKNSKIAQKKSLDSQIQSASACTGEPQVGSKGHLRKSVHEI